MNAALSPELIRNRTEILRHIRNRSFERTAHGIRIPKMGIEVSGFFDSWVNGEDHQVDPNLIVNTGLDAILTGGLVSGTYYIAPFSGTTAVVAGLTAATFTGNQTEFTNYTESTRVQWQKDALASQSLTNATNKAVFTADTGGGTVWGAGLMTASTKSATTGTLIAAAKFSAARTLLATDTLTLQYTLGLTSS